MVADALSRKSRLEDVARSSEIDSLFNELRRLLLESSQQEEVIASLQEVKATNYDKLKVQQREDLKLMDVRQRDKNGILLYEDCKVISTNWRSRKEYSLKPIWHLTQYILEA